MSILVKILLTIPSLLSLSFFASLVFLDLPLFIDHWEVSIAIVNGLTILQLIILLIRVWRFKNVNQDKKTLWTVLMIFVFNQLTTLIYIWFVDNKFQKLNQA